MKKMIPSLNPAPFAGHARRICLLLFLFLLTGVQLFAQELRVSGKLTSSTGEPLSGVSVSVKGTNIGTTTDAQGAYSLAVPNANSILVFSYVGYATREQRAGAGGTVDLTLTSSDAATNLTEVVVIGYGTAQKRDLTGSIVKISGKEVADKPNTNPIASLQGKVAGLSFLSKALPSHDNRLP